MEADPRSICRAHRERHAPPQGGLIQRLGVAIKTLDARSRIQLITVRRGIQRLVASTKREGNLYAVHSDEMFAGATVDRLDVARAAFDRSIDVVDDPMGSARLGSNNGGAR